ncbi:MAG: hypothetical protein WBZ20_03940 [Nitrososphaeraceae archaeon]
MSLNVMSTVSCNRGDLLQITKDDVSGEVEKVISEPGDVEDQRKEETNKHAQGRIPIAKPPSACQV